MYEYELPFYTTKHLNDTLTNFISNNLKCDYNEKIYDIVKNNSIKNPIIVGGLIIKNILKQPLVGDLDLVYPVSDRCFEEMLYISKEHLNEYINDHVVKLNKWDFNFMFDKIKKPLLKFNLIDDFAVVNTDINQLIIFSNNNESTYQINNFNLTFKPKSINNIVSVINNSFILNRYFVEIVMSGNEIYEKKGMYKKQTNQMILKYYFLDICIETCKNTRIVKTSLYNGLSFDVNTLIVDQVHAIVLGLYHNNYSKIKKRMERIKDLLPHYVNQPHYSVNFNNLIVNAKKIMLIELKVLGYDLGLYLFKWFDYLMTNDLIIKDISCLTYYRLSDTHVINSNNHFTNVKKKFQEMIKYFYDANNKNVNHVFNKADLFILNHQANIRKIKSLKVKSVKRLNNHIKNLC